MNLSHVVPINYKITVTLVNQFVVSSIQFLNRFVSRCDDKLRQVSEGMHRIEITLCILEAKLNSIPSTSEQATAGTGAAGAPTSSMTAGAPTSSPPPPPLPPPPPPGGPGGRSEASVPAHAAEGAQQHAENHQGEEQAASSFPSAEPEPVIQGPLLKDDVRFSKYFKMVKMGVPVPAVKLKMQTEGLDPCFLDLDPESPAPPMPEGLPQAAAAHVNKNKSSSDEEDSEFSDDE